MSTTPQGWYPDPHDGRSMRWWDGQAWTDHVQPLPTESAPTTAAGTADGPPPSGSAPSAPAQPPFAPAPPFSPPPPGPASAPAPPIEPPPPGPASAPQRASPGPAAPQRGGSGSVGPVIAIVAGIAVLIFGIAIAVFASGFGASETASEDAAVTTAEAAETAPPPAPDEGPRDGETPPGSDDGPGEAPPPPGSPDAELAAVEGQPVISGTPLMPSGGDTDDPAIGEPVPVVDGAGPAGTPVSIGSSGEPQLVLMVASWCPACHMQLPEFAAWREQGGDEDVEVVVVVTLLEPDRPGWPADEWALAEDIPADLIMDDRYGSVANAYGLYAVPYWVVIDADGHLVQRQAGVIEPERISELADAARTGSD